MPKKMSPQGNFDLFTIGNMEEMSEIIKKRAKVLGLKQVDFVRATGASKGTVSKWFSGDRKPEEYLVEVSNLLKIDPTSFKKGILKEVDPFSIKREEEDMMLEQTVYNILLNAGIKVPFEPEECMEYDMEIMAPCARVFHSFYVETKRFRTEEEATIAKQEYVNINKERFTVNSAGYGSIFKAVLVSNFDIQNGFVLKTILKQLSDITGKKITLEMITNKPPCNTIDSNIEIINNPKKVPVIDMVAAGDWTEAIDPYAVGDAESWELCPVPHGENTFAVRINGESMMPKFLHGDIIFCDPSKQANNGDYVIAKLTDENMATFKQLVIEGEQRILKAINPNWPVQYMPINGNCHIVGKVIAKIEKF